MLSNFEENNTQTNNEVNVSDSQEDLKDMFLDNN